ncbi:MAG: hypothetical protein RI963_1072 [Planctomycetota bacterium]|jgi:uncharacterized protein with von Willebrand factor type A (vWA) domain
MNSDRTPEGSAHGHSPKRSATRRETLGGIVHTYQKYNPTEFPSPQQPPPDLVSPAFEQALQYGSFRKLTEEELARAVRLDPSQMASIGPSIDFLKAMLEERKRRILQTYETETVLRDAAKAYHKTVRKATPPDSLRPAFKKAADSEQIYLMERLWYRIGDDQHPFARQMVHLLERLGEKYQVDELASKYAFTGRQSMDVPQAIEIKKELEKIDELLKQLEEAAKTAQLALIDMEALAEFAEPGDLTQLEEMKRQIENYTRELAQRQGLEQDGKGGFRLTPQAYRLFQGKLLERIFSHLQPSRSGRHNARVEGDGAVELPSTKEYEFGDSIANIDTTQSILNALRNRPDERPVRLRAADMEVHQTRNNPKCATVVVMDMSGSMRYSGQYIHVKRMALALQGLITSEYPGDFLRFIEMATFAKLRTSGEIVELMPKPVTIHDPWVRLKCDMSREEMQESMVHPHFTNIQHALRLARQNLATIDTPNKQIIVITDGLPTAHFEDNWLYMLYPPDPRTEEATLLEGARCRQAGITINLFLIPSFSQSEEDIRFGYRLAESTKGRVFFSSGDDLDRFVVWDYVDRKREILR